MNNERLYLGMDIGSVSAELVVISESHKVLKRIYARINGKPLQTAHNLLAQVHAETPLNRFANMAFTGSGGVLAARLLETTYINEIVANARAISNAHPEVKTVIEMGGEDAKLLILTRDQRIRRSIIKDFAMNAVCAAGTGSFLDQQAARLGVSITDFGELALKSEHPPRIAGRCSVFAKSDMIHLQQIATPEHDIVAGLCFAVARNFKSTVARGKKLHKPIAFQGGVAANKGMVRAFTEVLGLAPGELIVPENHQYMGATGAILTILDMPRQPRYSFPGLHVLEVANEQTEEDLHPYVPLAKDFSQPHYNAEITPLPVGVKTDAWLGLDIGSLSTNVVVIDHTGNVLARRYLPTAGTPIDAVRQGLKEVGDEVGAAVNIRGVGTTGSGRYMIGDFTGADIVRNEITAQATAAIHIDPTVDTIFEIGGQDSKYIRIENGAVVDFEMNKVCAAGTGSFLEEQAEKLGVHIQKDFEKAALCSDCPTHLGERCTVFIESDLLSHQQRGANRDDLLAGLAYSIVHNYINKIVGEHTIGDRIFFQGGVAWNQSVVAAFAKETGKEITVPPHHDVTGALGAALLALNEHGNKPTSFKGFTLSETPYTTTTFECNSCSNHCSISKVIVEGRAPLFYGARCEKYEVLHTKKDVPKLPDLFALRDKIVFSGYTPQKTDGRKRIGIPRSLIFYDIFPFWSGYFASLGFQVVLSDESSRIDIDLAMESAAAETCFPVKLLHGHMLQLREKKVDYLFLPSIINVEQSDDKTENSYLCPYIQALPYMVSSVLAEELAGIEMLTPAFHFGWERKHLNAELIAFGTVLGSTKKSTLAAIAAGDAAMQAMRNRFNKAATSIKKGISQDSLVILSRPYNSCDPGLNLDLPKKLRDMGVLAIPIDFLPLEKAAISSRFPNMYWSYGQKILQAVEIIREHPQLHALYITNFGCGPDSFISHYVRDRMEGKPYLQVEVDEHAADAGVITRCEAFLDSIRSRHTHGITDKHIPSKISGGADFFKELDPDKTIYVPFMGDVSHATAAVLRAGGMKAEVLPEPDKISVERGREHSSGRECFPYILTSGDILKKIDEEGFDAAKSAFLMPAANGPCRFGQYHTMHNVILKAIGRDDVELISPNSKYSYTNMLSPRLRFRVWEGIVAMEILQRLAREIRPYETVAGTTTRTYESELQELIKTLEHPTKSIREAVRGMAILFKRIPVDYRHRKPVIGIIGEVFVRSTPFSNAHIVDKIEALGGVARIAPVSEWLLYINHRFMEDRVLDGEYSKMVKMFAQDKLQKMAEHRLMREVKDLLPGGEPTTKEVLANSAPYMHKSFGGESILGVGKAIDFAHQGLSGIINVMPFTCMYGTIVTALSKQLHEDLGGIPWLNTSFDGQEDRNLQTRLEAFMYQTAAFHAASQKSTSRK